MSVSEHTFRNMVAWNLPGASIEEVEADCTLFDWYAVVMYLGTSGEAVYRRGTFTFHFGPVTMITIPL